MRAELSQFSEPELRKELSRRRKLRKEVKRKAHGEPKRRKGMGVRIGLLDVEATKARKFLDPGSFVRTDGTEVCKGRDWLLRKGELRERSGGRCEYMVPLFDESGEARCEAAAVDPCHMKPRYPRRDDRMSNLMDGCRICHDLHDEQGWRRVRSGKDGA